MSDDTDGDRESKVSMGGWGGGGSGEVACMQVS